MYCPNCGSTLRAGAGECLTCDASFTAGAAWKPVPIKPNWVVPDEAAINDPFSVAFSGKALLLFLLLGPLVAFLGAGGGVRGSAPALMPVYLVGSFLAMFVWTAFSFSLAAWYAFLLRVRGAFLPVRAPPAFVLGALIGAGWGFFAWSMLTCLSARWVVGGWGSCFAVVFVRDFGVSLMPGAITGGLACHFLCSRLPSVATEKRASAEDSDAAA